MLRLDGIGTKALEVSIAIEESMQGQGLGRAALSLVRRLAPGADLAAAIHRDNTASLALFSAAGYAPGRMNLYWSRGSIMSTFAIAGRQIGPTEPPYIIAELSGNHNGDINRALRLIEVAKEAGADAVKLQTYTADTITLDHDGPDFLIKGGPWDGRRLYELYSEAHTPWEWHPALFAYAAKLGVHCFSSPFDPTAIDFLETLVPRPTRSLRLNRRYTAHSQSGRDR